MKVVQRGRIEYTERAFDQDASSAMRGKIERALVELITNADDSYARLEEKGVRAGGQIGIEVDRYRKKPWKVIVRDRAEGMSLEEMKRKLCQAGGQTSGFQAGVSVRGLLGRGAKDVAAFGQATFESIKDDTYQRCVLDSRGNYKLFESTRATKSIRDELKLPKGNGTIVTIDVDAKYDAPRHTTLVDKLPSHYALRDIASDPKRKFLLTNLRDKGHTGDYLVYKYPEGKLVLEEEFEVPSYPGAKATLRIWRAPERFTEDVNIPYRQGGILIKSRRAIHEVTLFGLENDPYADWFFGKLDCPYIDELIKQHDTYFETKKQPPASNPIRLLARQREGLIREHPFTESLYDEAEKRLRALVEQERKKDEERRSKVENDETTKALRKLASAASKFVQEKLREFEVEQTGRASQVTGELCIIPPVCTLQPGENKTFSVLAREELISRSGAIVSLSSEGEGVELIDRQTCLSPQKDRPEIHSGTFRVIGKIPGALCLVRSILGEVSADACIQVQEKDPSPIPVGLTFDHSTYHIRFGKTKRLTLRAKIPREDLDGVAVRIASDSTDVLPLKTLVTLKMNFTLGCYTANIFVSGKKLGGKAKIIAQVRGYLTEADVVVVQRDINGLFSFEIQLVDKDFGPQRAVWTEHNTKLEISARHKSLARYLGSHEKNFPGQEKPHFKVALAEIVADQVVRRLIELREEKQGPEPDLDAHMVYATHQKYVGEFLPLAHEIQLPRAELKKT